jgi:predicted nucleic acid-binding protein
VRQRWNLSFSDALIVQAAQASGCTELLTEDLHAGATIAGVRVVNPFG